MKTPELYSIGRISSVLTKPLCLFFAHNYLGVEAAQGLAVAFVATALMLLAIGADPHRWFYAVRFAERPGLAFLSFYVYVSSVAMLAVAGAGAAFLIVLGTTGSVPIALATALYFLSEKLADERLRIRLFENNFGGWGRYALIRSSLQVSALAITYVIAGAHTPGVVAVCALLVGNALTFLPGVPDGVWKALLAGSRPRRRWLTRRSTRSLARHWRLWLTALVTGAIGYLDRVVALAIDDSLMALFVLVIMAFSIVQMAVDFFYVSTHRRQFLRGDVSLKAAVASPALIASVLGGLVGSIAVCAAVLAFSRNGHAFPVRYVAVIAIFQLAVALSAVPQMIVYWSARFHTLLVTEGAFWALLVLTTGASVLFGRSVVMLLGGATVLVVLRTATYVWLAHSVHRDSP
jgi:hypothetical protein